MKVWEPRFWAKVHKTETCWLWTAQVGQSGYGRFKLEGYPTAAHRLSYELAKGPIPRGYVMDHLCRNKRCVNPTHLEAVTVAENTTRGLTGGLHQLLKTHCPQGHPYNAVNTYAYRGGRQCKTCRRLRKRADGLQGNGTEAKGELVGRIGLRSAVPSDTAWGEVIPLSAHSA